MRSLALLVLVAVALLALPAGAHAQRAWQAPTMLTDRAGSSSWSAGGDTALTVTAHGETIATWVNQTGSDWTTRQTMIATRSPSGATTGPEPLGAGSDSSRVKLAADALGNAYVTYAGDPATQTVRFKVRPPGGSFGSEEILPLYAVEQLLAAPDGDVAALWWDDGVHVAFRPAGGTFGPPEKLLPYSQSAGGWSAAYSANGDLVLGAASYSDTSQPGATPARVYGAVRTAAGALSVRELTDGTRHARSPAVGVDDSGRAVLAFAEQKNLPEGTLTGTLVSQRQSGGEFGAPVALSRPGGYSPAPQVVTGRDGLFTIAYSGGRGLRVVTGRTGEAPRHLRSYYNQDNGESTRLVTSPSGNHTLLSHGVQSEKPATSLRSGDGPFGPSQDVRTDCGGVQFARLAVGDGGHGAALVQKDSQVLLVTDAPGTGTRNCVPDYYPEYNPSQYDDDPYLPRTHGGPGGGSWEFDDDVYSGGGGGPPAPAALPIGNPTIVAARAGQRKRKARVVVVCGKPCSISARAKIGFDKGKTLVKGRTRSSAKGKPKLVEVPLTLSSAVAKTIDAALKDKKPKRTLLLTISVTATVRGQKKQTRDVVAVLGRPPGPF